MSKQVPQWRFTVYPTSAIPQRKIEAYAIADILADVISGRPSSWSGVLTRGASGNQWSDWGRLGDDLLLHNVGFARFGDAGEVRYGSGFWRIQGKTGAGGFFVLPTNTPLPVAGDKEVLGTLAKPGGEVTDGEDAVMWLPKTGAFQASRALTSTGTTALLNAGNPAQKAIAVTEKPWKQGRGLSLDVSLEGTRQQNNQARCLIRVSENLRVALRQGQFPALERRVLTRTGNRAKESWTTWRTMESLATFDTRDTQYSIGLHVIGNRLIWEVDGEAQWMLDSAVDASKTARSKGATAPDYVTVADMSSLIGGAPLSLETENLRARVEVARRSSDAPGTVTRTVTKNSPTGQRLDPYGVGHLPPGTELPVTVTETGDQVSYAATLAPSEDGVSTPFLSQVYLAYKPVWSTPVGGGIDISRIVTRATVSHAHPPVQAGTEGSVTIDLALMGKKLPGAAPYLRDYHPVEIEGRWDGGPWRGLTKGYFAGVSGEQRAYNDATLTLTVQGPMMRLKKLASVIDGQCVPLDYYYQAKLQSADKANQEAAENDFSKTRDSNGRILNARPYPKPAYYGADAVKDIIEHFLGPQAAAKFNGNGNARRFLPAGHPPLISYSDVAGSWLAVAEIYGQTLSAGSIQAQKGAMLVPPFGQDALSWCNQFAADEWCLFTEGYADRDTRGWPDLLYGTREEILSTAKLHEISGNDVEKLLAQAASYETKPEKDLNRVLVWGKPWGQDVPLSPAFVQGEARFSPLHPRSAEQTWPRTLVLETPLAATPARAQALAAVVLMESDGEQFVYPKYSLLGDADCMTGDVFTARNVGLLGNEDIWFRSASVGHEYTQSENAKTWMTNVALQTMSRSEIFKFQRTWIIL
jgi:hypothetical protein